MSKFKDYLKFKELSVKLVSKDIDESEVVHDIQSKYDIKQDVITSIKELNKLLGRHYNGYAKFSIVNENTIEEQKIKLNKRIKEKIRLKQLLLNDEFSKIKTKLENDIKKEIK